MSKFYGFLPMNEFDDLQTNSTTNRELANKDWLKTSTRINETIFNRVHFVYELVNIRSNSLQKTILFVQLLFVLINNQFQFWSNLSKMLWNWFQKYAIYVQVQFGPTVHKENSSRTGLSSISNLIGQWSIRFIPIGIFLHR